MWGQAAPDAGTLCANIANPIGFDARLVTALGIGRYVSSLLPGLAARLGERLTVVARSPDLALVRTLVGRDVSLIVGDASPYRLAEQTALLLQLRRQHLALLHFPHYNLPLGYPGPFVVTVHDLFSLQFPEIHSGRLPRAVNHLLIRTAVARAQAIITPSRATAAAVAARFPRAARKVVTIAEAADPRFNPVRNPSAEAAWQAHFGIRPPYILYLGQWKAYKNVMALLDAFRTVLGDEPQLQLVLGGRDARHPEIPRAAAGFPAGRVIMPGRLPDDAVADLYRGAAAVVVPSRAEGFGLPVIEALASGTRVVCSDIPVLREIADGVAVFCDPGSPASLAQGILTAVRPDPTDRRRELGLARAGAFSWERAAEETVAVYERVLGLVRVPLKEDASGG